MELSVNARRSAQIQKTAPRMEKKTVGAGIAFRKSRTDRLALSQQALSFLQEMNRQDLEKRRKLLEAKQQSGGEMEMLSKSLKVMDKCQKIAARIIKGDKVPPQDEMFLMESDPDGYKLALACRTPKEKPKEWESILDEEDRDSGGGTAGAECSGGDGGAPDSGGDGGSVIE